MKTRKALLGASLALLVAAVPAAACLTTVRATAAAEHAGTGCDRMPGAPATSLCQVSGTLIPADGPLAPPSVAAGLHAASHPADTSGEPAIGGADPPTPFPRARSAPIHLLLATFLI